MSFQSDAASLQKRDLADYGFARVRDLAFDAVHSLWRRRQGEGLKQKQLADAIGRDTGWVSRNLRGPGNWTLRTFGEFVEALGGEAEIFVFAMEDRISPTQNYDAYSGYVPLRPPEPLRQSLTASTDQSRAIVEGLIPRPTGTTSRVTEYRIVLEK